VKTSKLQAEAEKQILENEKLRLQIEQSKLNVALQLAAKLYPKLTKRTGLSMR